MRYYNFCLEGLCKSLNEVMVITVSLRNTLTNMNQLVHIE